MQKGLFMCSKKDPCRHMLTFRPEVISRVTGLHSVCSGLSDLAPSMACTLRRMHALSNLAPMHAIVHVNLSPPQLSTSLIIFFCQKKTLNFSAAPDTHRATATQPAAGSESGAPSPSHLVDQQQVRRSWSYIPN